MLFTLLENRQKSVKNQFFGIGTGTNMGEMNFFANLTNPE